MMKHFGLRFRVALGFAAFRMNPAFDASSLSL